jgi:hypothetical protein
MSFRRSKKNSQDFPYQTPLNKLPFCPRPVPVSALPPAFASVISTSYENAINHFYYCLKSYMGTIYTLNPFHSTNIAPDAPEIKNPFPTYEQQIEAYKFA